MSRQITPEVVQSFLEGHDPMERIVAIECAYNEDRAAVVYVNEKGEKRVRMEDFKPFLWCKNSAAIRLFGGNRGTLRRKMREYGIAVKALQTHEEGKETPQRLENGYKYMFYATRRMSNSTFQNFFTEGGVPIHPRQKKGEPEIRQNEYITVPAIEQFMISTGKRLFKGWDNYDMTTRLLFDLETQGLNPRIHRIDQIGIRTNKGFEQILTVTGNTEAEKDKCELAAIITFVSILADIKPDIVAGHNSENFDWDFIITRCQMLGTSLENITMKYFKHPIYKQKKTKVLKLGGEVEYYYPTIMWGHTMLDSLHAVRRAQAIDSSFKSASLKYATKYLNLKKPNRVYVPGNKITETWNVTEDAYAFNNHDGDWYKITDETPLKEGYEKTSGRYIVERYLLDDIWETDKVELTLNEANFQVAKLLPTTFSRACTMGTAGIWKLIMFAWCYENELSIPEITENARFVGGLSRLLVTGRVDRIVKLDYNSLYPSIILTWGITNPLDTTHIMNHLLDYILTNREKYKNLKAEAGEKADELKGQLKTAPKNILDKLKEEIAQWKIIKSANDKKQLPFKILANSYFGASGGPSSFPHAELNVAEKTTCIGRQSLRLMIYHFSHLSDDPEYNYRPIVGDSFTGDTPLFIKYNYNNHIDIKPIEELIGETETDALGREYDTSEKPYKVLCRSGWVSPEYIYRHASEKPLYEVSEGDMSVTVTEDHSLFTKDKVKIKPSQINNETELEYYNNEITYNESNANDDMIILMSKMLNKGSIDRVPLSILNLKNKNKIKLFLDNVKENEIPNMSKTCLAGLLFLKKQIN